MFANMYSLQENPYINTASGVNLSSMFSGNINAKKGPVLDLSIVPMHVVFTGLIEFKESWWI